jgi:hypothetical protein
MGYSGSKKMAKRFAASFMCDHFEKMIWPPTQQEEHQPCVIPAPNQLEENQGFDTCGKYDLRIRPHSSGENQQQMMSFPRFQSFDSRLGSFYTNQWSATIQQPSREDLANAGFFYTGRTDETICFHCGGGIHKWKEYDTPILLHKQFFPKCEFIKNK